MTCYLSVLIKGVFLVHKCLYLSQRSSINQPVIAVNCKINHKIQQETERILLE